MAVKYSYLGRPITLGEFYEDDHGYAGRYYTFDDDPKVVHWMSTSALLVRLKPIGDE
jgi:hypothetical protein